MEAVKNLDIKVLLFFAVGACIGITSFSRILSYALKKIRHHFSCPDRFYAGFAK